MSESKATQKASVKKSDLIASLMLEPRIEEDDNIESIIVSEKGIEVQGWGWSKSGEKQQIHMILPTKFSIVATIKDKGLKTIIK